MLYRELVKKLPNEGRGQILYKGHGWAIGFWKATVAYMLPRLPPNVNVGCCTLELHPTHPSNRIQTLTRMCRRTDRQVQPHAA